MTIGKLSGQCDFGQKGQSYCNQRGQSCVAKRVKVAWLFHKRPKGDKYDRIEASQSFFERRNVWFNIDEKESADQIELVDQYLEFEKGNESPVDGPDAAEGAFSKLNTVSYRAKTTYRYGKRESRRF